MLDFIHDPSLILYLPLWLKDGKSFTSEDAYGRLCTVTGATWGITGRNFNGTSDQIVTNFNQTGNRYSAVSWVKPSSLVGDRRIAFALNFGGMFFSGTLLYSQIYNGAGYDSVTADIGVVDVWQCVGTVFTGAALVVYRNGVEVNRATLSLLVPGSNSWYIGNYEAGASWFSGLMGDVWIYNRALTAQEIQHNYLATNRRYQ